MGNFEEKIKKVKLTKTGHLIAEYCLQNPHAVPFQSLVDIANRIGVSDVSIIRFARALGYSGFIELKEALQEELCRQIDSNPKKINPVAKFLTRKDMKLDTNNFMLENANSIYTAMIDEVFTRNSPNIFAQVATRLMKSGTKYIAGFRTRRTAAVAMSTLMRMVLPGVVEISDESYSSFQKTLDFNKKDCLLFFTFGRFSQFEKQLLHMVQESGIYFIVVTDQRASPSALAADMVVYSSGDVNLPFFSSIGNVIISECIFNIIAEHSWDSSRQRIQKSEDYLNSLA